MTVTSILINPQERTRFLRFAFVGVVGAVVDFGTFNLLSSALGISAVLASVISFMAAILSNFTWNRYWTYPDSRTKPVTKQLIQFSVVSVVGLFIRTPIIALLETPLERLFERASLLPVGFVTPKLLGENLALAVAVIIVMFWNFFINRYWTYSDIDK